MTARGDATGAPREHFDIIYRVADLVFCLVFYSLAQYCKHGDEQGGRGTKKQQLPSRVFRRALRH